MQAGSTDTPQRQVFSLSEITGSIERMFSKYYASAYWIRAEISKLNFYPASGHCFPDLVEKQEGKVRAQVRSIIWRDDLYRISQKFADVAREPLSEGMAIMFQAYVRFTSEYGLSLHIIDIEPLYTLGEMAREKLATIERLKKEGIFHNNRQLQLPLLLKSVAVISAETSKGYSDLMVTLEENPYGYRFITQLFPALLQGDGAVESIRKQLIRIKNEAAQFDAVLIVRGGGDEVGLACYDHYELAAEVACFPLPVITGIGHSTNETVVEMIACINKITPTDVAHFMIDGFRSFGERVTAAEHKMLNASAFVLQAAGQQFSNLTGLFQQAARSFVNNEADSIALIAAAIRESVHAGVFNHRIALSRYETSLMFQPAQLLVGKRSELGNRLKMLALHNSHLMSDIALQLDRLEKSIHLLDPVNVLKRGFTITRSGGKALRPGHHHEPGLTLETETLSEIIISKVSETRRK